MVRRTHRRQPRQSSSAQAIQILGLVVILVMILLFRDQIGAGAGAFFDSFDSEDVQLPEESATADDVDAGATTGTPAP